VGLFLKVFARGEERERREPQQRAQQDTTSHTDDGELLICVAHAHVFVGCSNLSPPPRVGLAVPRVAHVAEEPVYSKQDANSER